MKIGPRLSLLTTSRDGLDLSKCEKRRAVFTRGTDIVARLKIYISGMV